MTRHTALVVDASVSLWAKIAQLTSDVMAALPDGAVLGIHLLGTRLRWESDDWRAAMLLPLEASASPRLLAPVMAALRARHDQPSAIVLIGAGDILDFDDWADRASWAWIRMGDESQSGLEGSAAAFEPNQLVQLSDWLHTSARFSSPRLPPPSGVVEHQWELDRAGYPLVCVEPLGIYMHLFPVVKPQVESFLAEARQATYDSTWYAELLKLNRRLSPAARSLAHYEQLFVTGLLPDDVQAFARWSGPGYAAPTVEQWRTAFQWLEKQSVSILPAKLERDLSPTAHRLWAGLLDELRPQTLFDLSLMRNGVVEWVSGPGGTWLGMGQPRESFYPNFHDALHDKPFEPTSLTRRSRLFGLRLMRSAG